MQEGRGWVSAFRWLGCYPRRKWNGPAPKNEVPGDWPPSFLALPGLGRGRLAPASLEVQGLGSLPWGEGSARHDGRGEACVPMSELLRAPTNLPALVMYHCTPGCQVAAGNRACSAPYNRPRASWLAWAATDILPATDGVPPFCF